MFSTQESQRCFVPCCVQGVQEERVSLGNELEQIQDINGQNHEVVI